MYKAISPTSIAEDMTSFVICAMVSTAPLFHGTLSTFDSKKFLPVQLHALISDRYEASLCAASSQYHVAGSICDYGIFM
jgi:hypothetical protein